MRRKTLRQKLVASSFTKIRIRKEKVIPDLENLFCQREKTMQEIAACENAEFVEKEIELRETLEKISKNISDICADKNKLIIDEFIGDIDSNSEGFNQIQTWGLKKKLVPRNTIDPPAAKKNDSGELITDKKSLEKLYLETYKNRLAPNDIPEDLLELKDMKEYLFYIRKKIAKDDISEDWNIVKLEKVLKSLKNSRARDAHGHVYELFKYGGSSLKYSLLRMFNFIKKKQIYPKILQVSNISSFWKKKGDRNDLNNDRGVFNVVKVRTILDKLVYNDFYETIDSRMSCSNIGARKHRNIRDHIFVVNSIFNDIHQNKPSQGIDCEIYDISKCFDKMWYAETANDLYKSGVQNDKFILVANSNKEAHVAVKTPWGALTERVTLNDLEMQGTVLSNIKCSVQIDSLGQDCLTEKKGIFKYKNCISVPPLSMVDDIITISNCGSDSVIVNGIVQSKIQCKQLQLGHSKCFQLHIGKKSKHLCPKLKVHENEMKTSDKETYLGNLLTTDGKIDQNINSRCQKGIGKTNEIISILREVSLGPHYFQTALLFRNSILMSSMLCSTEVLLGLNKTHIEKLEQVDRAFFRRLFDVPRCTAIESFYLETAAIPVRFLLVKRRLLYYWSVLAKSDNELVKKVYNAQKAFPVKNDWIHLIKEDLDICEIELSENEISKMKQITFKKLVNEKIQELSISYLISLKNKHSKSENLSASYDMQPYLKNTNLSIEEKKIMFRIRNRLIDVKMNFKKKYNDMVECRLCGAHEESQSHLVECSKILADTNIKVSLQNYTYSDIFSTHEPTQTHMVKTWKQIMNKWKIEIKKQSDM